MGAVWWGMCRPHLFIGGNIIWHVPLTSFSLGFVFGDYFKNKSDVCHVLLEELFMLDGK